ncbi:MAG: VIT domain-containing protein [Pseudomonadota bacterium]
MVEESRPDRIGDDDVKPVSSQSESPAKRPGWKFLVFGTAVPLAVVFIEFTTRVCAMEFFDPIPTLLHTMAAIFVPFANLAVWYVVRNSVGSHVFMIGLANGAAIGISLYYTLVFLPLLPFALIAVVVFGIGILPMAPLFALVAALWGRRYLRRLHRGAAKPQVRLTLAGAAMGLLALIALNIPITVTRIGMQMAVSEDADTRSTGLKVLRIAGNNELMLRSCYQRLGKTMDLVSLLVSAGNPLSPSNAREVYYRATGVPFNSLPPPSMVLRGNRPLRLLSFDPDQGGTTVGGKIKGLSLADSRLDGSMDSDAAPAYVEWTMEFRNDSLEQQEARAQIALPPGGVVSRLTLWIDGQEREAAFAGRKEVRQAYERVVQKRRDPVLVTTHGPDRILMQCFPVPPHGGKMKLRIGITVPLLLPAESRAVLRLPSFIERNFRIDDAVRHMVWLESAQALESRLKAVITEETAAKAHTLRGSITDRELAEPISLVTAHRSPHCRRAWTTDDIGAGHHIVLQTLKTEPNKVPGEVVLVVDGSSSMSGSASHIREAVASLPAGIRLTVLLAGDRPAVLWEEEDLGSDPKDIPPAGVMFRAAFTGGQDNVPALARAWDIAARKGGGAVVWVHGPQPVEMTGTEILRQKWERRPDGPVLYEIQAGLGRNTVVEALDGIAAVKAVPRLGTVREDLERLFTGWKPGSEVVVAERQRLRADEVKDLKGAKRTSNHLARLWAHDEVLRLLRSGKSAAKENAVEPACRYQLVTPVTGAVVLETAGQYAEAGLTPVSADKVPTIPEPETWLLMGVLLAVFLWTLYHRRLKWSAA